MKKVRLVDIIVMLEAVYILMCAALGYMNRLYGLPGLLKYTLIAASICGILFVWHKYRTKEYTNKGLLFMITCLPIMWGILLIIN